MRLIISPASDVSRVCRNASPSHLLRLLSPDQLQGSMTDLPTGEILTLLVHDIVEPLPGLIAPDAAMVERLLRFGRSWTGQWPLVAQCWAGVSRSTAAAFIVACDKRPDLPEAALAAALRAAAPQATPNRLMVRLADGLLERAGRMVAAVDAIGRGAEFSGFACAELDLAHSAP